MQKPQNILTKLYISICCGWGNFICLMVAPASLGLKGACDPYGLGNPAIWTSCHVSYNDFIDIYSNKFNKYNATVGIFTCMSIINKITKTRFK